MSRKAVYTLLLTNMLVAGCDSNQPAAVAETIRPIKTITLESPVNAAEYRKFSGLVQAKNVTELSFESGGKIVEILVDTGDRVSAQQILARLDDETFRLNLISAEANLSTREAEYKKFNKDYQRKGELREKGYVSASELDQAVVDRDSAKLGVKSAQTKLAIAERELNHTELRAPFNGLISSRLANPHIEIPPGQPLFEMDATGKLEVELKIPENLIGSIEPGKAGTAYVSNRTDTPLKGIVTQIGIRAKEGNTFLVDFEILKAPSWVLSGMSAEVVINLAGNKVQEGFLLPAPAILPDPSGEQHYVFVYQKASSTVKKTPVKVSGGQDQQALVTSGVSKGDIVAVAGASFLVDGMKVLPSSDKH